MIHWQEPPAKYEACNAPWMLFSPPLCSLHGTFSRIASTNMDKLPPDCNPHGIVVDLVWLKQLGDSMQAISFQLEGSWKLVLLPGPQPRHSESCRSAIHESSMTSVASIYWHEMHDALRVPSQFHQSFGRCFDQALSYIVGRCSEGNTRFIGNEMSNFSVRRGAFATLPGYMGFTGISPGGNLIGAIAVESEAQCKNYAEGIWPDWTDQDLCDICDIL